MKINDFSPEIDLHGNNIEDALELLDRFMDRAILSDEREVTVIHGHGSGKLKNAVRQHLSTSPYVSDHKPGGLWDGGDAVTVVVLVD
jgi:DNA mismatch repair protein MutS2